MAKVIGWDVETHLIEDGNITPRLVCLSMAGGEDTLEEAKEWWRIHAEDTFYSGQRDTIINISATTKQWEIVTGRDKANDLLCFGIEQSDILVAHNGAYDWGVMMNEEPGWMDILFHLVEKGKVTDTRVRQMLLAIATDEFQYDKALKMPPGGFSLAFSVLKYFRKDISGDKKDPNSWRLRYSELDGLPVQCWPDRAINYAAEDATWARMVYIEQSKPLNQKGYPVVGDDGVVVNETEQVAAAMAMQLMAIHGVYTDKQAVDAFSYDVEKTANQNYEVAKALGFLRINRCKFCGGTGWTGEIGDLRVCTACYGNDDETCQANGTYAFRGTKKFKVSKDSSRLKALVSRSYGGSPPMSKASSRFPGGQVKTDSDTLKGSGDKGLIQYEETLSAQKLLNTYVPTLKMGIDKPITSSPNVLVRSGRTSWRSPNFQNPPRADGFRDCFIPREGKVFASIDYSSLELATLAQVCLHLFGYSQLADLINGGTDPHLWFAAKLAGISYEEAVSLRSKGDPMIKERRQNAKIANFGLPGGLGVNTLVVYAKGFGVNLSFNEADDLIKSWKASFPEMSEYFKMMSNADRSTGGSFTLQQLGSNRVRGGCFYTSGCNTLFQGLAADGAKAAMWELTKQMYIGKSSPLYGVRCWAFIHDEFLFEGPKETAHIWAPHASKVMVEEMKRFTPDVKIEAAPALMTRWFKSAEPRYDNEKLVPWK